MPFGLPLFSTIFNTNAGSAPTVTTAYRSGYVQYNATGLQDPAGGNNIIVNGTGFVSGLTLEFQQAAVAIGSASGGGIAYQGPTQFYATCPALPEGIYDLVVINPDTQTSGATGNALHESYEISTDTWMCLLEPGNYDPDGVAPGEGRWTDTSGNSNHADWTVAAGATSPADDGFGVPVFAGTDALIINESFVEAVAIVAPMASYASGTVIMFFESDSTDLDAIDYTNRGLINGTGASPGMFHSATGLKSVAYDGITALYQPAYSLDPVSIGEKHMGAMSWSSIYITSIVDGGTQASSVMSDGIPNDVNTGSNTWLGRSFSDYYKGKISMVAITPNLLTELHMQKIREWGILTNKLPAAYFVPSVTNDAGLFTWHRSDLGVLTNVGDTELLILEDQVGDDGAKQLSPTAANPFYDLIDSNFGGHPSWGDDYANDTVSHMISGTFATPLEAPFTSYDVVRVITDVSGLSKYIRLNNAGTGLGAAAYGASGAIIATTDGVNTIASDPGIDVTSIVSVVYNGPTSASYVNAYSTQFATGDTGTGLTVDGFAYTGMGTGSYSGEATRLRQAEKIVSAGAHDAVLRKKYIAYLGARYKLPVAI